jgi:hypothetical protein
VNSSLTIETDWESSTSGRPEDAATFAALGIKFGNLWFTEAEDSFVNRVRHKVHLSAYTTGRRFALARLIGDKIAGSPSGPFKLAAPRTYTYRQKLQRAFAGEFLCPFEELEKMLGGDFGDDAIQDAAQHFEVSDITVRTLLVNHGVIDRDNLIDDFDVPAKAVAA